MFATSRGERRAYESLPCCEHWTATTLLVISCVKQIWAAFLKIPKVARKRRGGSEVPIVPGRVRADLICSTLLGVSRSNAQTQCLLIPCPQLYWNHNLHLLLKHSRIDEILVTCDHWSVTAWPLTTNIPKLLRLCMLGFVTGRTAMTAWWICT